jgi:hypothetical protein
VALTYDYVSDGASLARLYLDGVEAGAVDTAVGPLAANTVPLNFGRYYWSSSYARYLDGRLDEVRVYDRALTPPEVLALAWRPATGDFTGDGVVDGADGAALLDCLAGPDAAAAQDCRRAFDFDADGDVDVVDVGRMQGVVGE